MYFDQEFSSNISYFFLYKRQNKEKVSNNPRAFCIFGSFLPLRAMHDGISLCFDMTDTCISYIYACISYVYPCIHILSLYFVRYFGTIWEGFWQMEHTKSNSIEIELTAVLKYRH